MCVPPTHTRARPALVHPRLWLLARVHTVPGVQLMSCHACGWFIKGNTTQTVPGTAQEPARDAREQLLGAVLCVSSRSSSPDKPSVSCEDARAERWSTHNAERPRLLFRTALSDGMFCLEAGGGVQLACGSLSPPCRAKLSEVGSASWLASQSALPAAHIICARTWGETTRSQYSAA